jgi:serine protease
MTSKRTALQLAAASVASAITLLIGHAPASAGTQAAQIDVNAQSAATATTDRMIIKYRGASEVVVRAGRGFEAARVLPSAELSTHVEAAQRSGLALGVQMQLLRQMGTGAHVFRLDRRMAPAEMERLATQLRADNPAIEYAEPDRRMFPLLTPNDSSYTSQWDLYDATGGIRAPAAWDKATGSGVVVAVIDTGIRPHADLAGQTVAGYDMIIDTAVSNDGNGRDGDPSDPGDWVAAGECGAGEPADTSSWHGTHVAGTIAAATNNGQGIAGIAFGAKVQMVRALGKCGGYTSDIADGITWASGGSVSGAPANATPAKVLNLSLGGGGACDNTTQAAVNGARARGSVVVVAAGNSAANAANFSPASCSGVIAVAATDRNGARAYYSNFGAVVALAAPGGDVRGNAASGILSTLNSGTSTPGGDSYAYYQGTSMASPHVAGVAALMFSVKPSATPDEIANALKSSARAFPGSCSQCGSGLLDAAAAVTAIGGGTTPPPSVINEAESNNSRVSANLVGAPALVNGTLSSTDTDYFRVDLPAGKALTASLNPGTRDYDLYLYNSGGTQIASSVKAAGQVDSLGYSNGGSAAVTLYVRVRYYSGGAGSYTLNLGW